MQLLSVDEFISQSLQDFPRRDQEPTTDMTILMDFK